ncbi:hypothetical protein DINM_020961 [Dirofilaria immitis]|nr:hypothetical protein [Dirofilaria immitis]
MDIEEKYVRKVYGHLASYSDASYYRNRNRTSILRWINVQKFVNQFPLGTIAIDIGNSGCGEAKYYKSDCFFMDCDTCLEMLKQLRLPPMVDLQLADALNLPYRSNSIDAALLVSVLHHFTTLNRRKRALTEVARCLRSRGRVLIYVWAFEQPNRKFPSQDVLVPCQLNHCDSSPSKTHNKCIHGQILYEYNWRTASNAGFYSYKLFGKECNTNWALIVVSSYLQNIPILSRTNATSFIISSQRMCKKSDLCPLISGNLRRLMRYNDELKSLIAMIPSLRIVHLGYEHANWWAIAEKVD